MNRKEEKESRILSITGQSTYLYQEAPSIRLHGKWLGKLGFRIGEKVLVEEGYRHLTISVITPEEEIVQQKSVGNKKRK
ncbi:hypothetical protein IRB23M11_13790 [Alkalibacterium sp. m-11]|uniref:Toxin SymE-like domain-containing protein n=1 Tax=Alkalibacterium indicireducens TaxID=398758 RepID=A0ABP3L0S0_9LACT